MKKILQLSAVLMFCITFAASAQIEGVWETTDDETKEKKSHIKIYKTQSGKYAGQVVKILREKKKNAVCKDCPGDRNGKPVQDMIVLIGLQTDGKEWSGGRILDPEKGKEYKCKAWMGSDNNTLNIRGFVGISMMGRNQVWKRVQ